ncbi:MAG: hypothetical protein ACM3PP_10050 [Candidatus Saccharibacteria bacterium]
MRELLGGTFVRIARKMTAAVLIFIAVAVGIYIVSNTQPGIKFDEVDNPLHMPPPDPNLSQAQTPVSPKLTLPNLPKPFRERNAGFIMKYPADWMFLKPDSSTWVFSGKPKTEAYNSTVTIQVTLPEEKGGSYSDINEVFTDYSYQVRSIKGKVLDKKNYLLRQGSSVYPCIEFKALLPREQKNVLQWVILVQGHDRNFYQFRYAAPQTLYVKYLPSAQAMVMSWFLMYQSSPDLYYTN